MQRTLKTEIELSGIGLHTGLEVKVKFKPAAEDQGIIFLRTDLEEPVKIPADVDLVTDTSRGTTLEIKGIKIGTIEHMMAAAYGMGIDNMTVEVNAPEMPILDGSSRFYVEAFEKAGIVGQSKERTLHKLTAPIVYSDPKKGGEYIALPSETNRFSVMIDYGSKVLDTQNANLNQVEDFAKEIAPCRTFVFLHELEHLIEHNLIKGGDLDNAIVFVNRMVSREELDRLSQFFKKPRVEVMQEGILNNIELHFQNEPARHKLLDVIGDLALVGYKYNAHIIATRPGHASNVEFGRRIKASIRREIKQSEIPTLDLNKKPLYDINDIKKMLPHRPPFLLVDKILEMSETYVVGLKNVTMNEGFFVGHFPDEPVMPAVLQIESMAQCGGILALANTPDPENYVTYFLKIENAKFRQKVVPGDTLVFRLDLISPIRRGLCNMAGKAYVGGQVVMEAEMLAQIVKNKQ